MRIRRAVQVACCALAVALSMTACGGDSGGGSSSEGGGSAAADAGAFPVTLKSKFGTAKISKQPRRVVALGWSDQDAALALGVKPVGIAKTESGFRHGVGPWAQQALGSARPEVLDTTDGYPFEKIAALHPDLILGVESGMTSSDYAKLSKLAPTVAYRPNRQPYGTPWQEQTKLIGKAVGREKEADQAVDRVDRGLAKDAARYPSLKGKSFVYAFPQESNGRIVLYTDERTSLLERVGLTLDPVARKAPQLNSFANALSTEHLDQLTSDALLVWYNSAQDRKKLESDGVFKSLPAVRHGAYVPVDRTLAQADSALSVLSIPWAMHRILPKLAAALH